MESSTVWPPGMGVSCYSCTEYSGTKVTLSQVTSSCPVSPQPVKCPGSELLYSDGDGCSVRQLAVGRVVHQGNFKNETGFCEESNLAKLDSDIL